MLLWSLREKRVPQHLYAEYCPLQRDIRLFHLFEVRRCLSVFFLPLASERVGHELQDLETGVLHWLPKHPKLDGVPGPQGDAESLAAHINPGALERRDAAMERDAAAMSARASFETRVEALLERFVAAEHWLRQATVRGGSESLIALQVAGFMLAAPAAAIAWSASLTWFFALASAAALLLLGAVWSILRQHSRTSRTLVLEVVRRSVEPLRPTPAEATEALHLAQRNGLRIATALRPADLLCDAGESSPLMPGNTWLAI